MSMSLREQLLQAGLGTRKQAKQAEHQQGQRQRSRNPAGKQTGSDDQRARVAQAQAAKAARDHELNRQRQERAENKARWAQIRQLIEQNRLQKIESDEYFNFIDRGKVRRLSVDAERRDRLIGGELVIVRCEGRYDVVTADVAARIREREPRAVVSLDAATPPARAENPGEDDPYKDYRVPDDLMW